MQFSSFLTKDFGLNKSNEIKVISVLLVLAFVADFIHKFGNLYNIETYSISLFLRSILLALAIVRCFQVLAFTKDFKNLALFFVIPVFLVVKLSVLDFSNYPKQNFIDLAKCFGLFYFIYYIHGYFTNSEKKKLITVFKLLYFITFVVQLTAFVFSIHFLKTYPGSFRFGFNGGIGSGNEGTMFFHLGLILFFPKKKDWESFIYFGIAMLFTFFTGTKSSLILGVLLSLYATILFFGMKGGGVSLVLFSLSLIVVSQTSTFDGFVQLAQEDGLMNSLTSYRWSHLECFIQSELGSWTVVDFILGRRYIICLQIEMDVFQQFIEGGLISILLLFCIWSKFSRQKIFFFSSILLIAMLAGHYFHSGINVFLLALLLFDTVEFKGLKE